MERRHAERAGQDERQTCRSTFTVVQERDGRSSDRCASARRSRDRALTRVLSDQNISGAPVVDAGGRLLGVVSASDVVRMTAEAADLTMEVPVRRHMDAWPNGDDPEDDELFYGDFFLPEETGSILSGWREEQGDSPLDQMTVEEIMTPVPFTVTPETGIRDLAGFLFRGRIHRAVVTHGGALVGIVTSMDVLQAVADEI